jgi:thiamine-phosphate pyrophosphorylase
MHFPRLYAIVDADTAGRHGWSVPDLGRAYLAGGARLLQVRAKHAGSVALLAWGEDLVAEAGRYGAVVIVNDRADVARLAGAPGVHVGQNDLPVADVRTLLGRDAIVGLSTHTPAQIEEARRAAISYLAVGPVYRTGTKDVGYAPIGLELVRQATFGAAGRPVVAIGGITLDRAADVIAAGAASVAVISDLLATGDPEARVRDYVQLLDRSQQGCRMRHAERVGNDARDGGT